jgi:PAS domain S-box-containing protein
MQELFGYTPEELASRSFLEFVHADDWERVLAGHLKRLKGERVPQDLSFRALRKDGIIRWLQVSGVGITWDGRPATLNFFSDITEQKTAEEALRASEERFRNLVETTNDIIWEIDENSKFLYVSPKILSILGYESQEVIGRRLHDLLLPGEIEGLHVLGFEIKKQKNAFNRFEARYLHEKGHTVVLETSGVPRFDHEGRFRGYRGISRDVTERRAVEEELKSYRRHLEEMIEERTSELATLNRKLKREIGDHRRTEEILRESMRRYREMIETTMEGVCIIDGEGKILFANRRFALMVGHTTEEMAERYVFEFVDETFLSREKARLERSRAGVKEQMDSCLRRKDGSRLWAIISSTPMFDEKQNFVGSLLMFTDISERREIEQKIHRSKMMLQKFFDGISEPLVMIDRDLKVVMLNIAARDYCGAPWQEIVGKPYDQTWTCFGPFEEFDTRSVFTKGQDFTCERKSPRNPSRFEKVILYPLREDGQDIQNAIIRVCDITEERALQREIIKNEKLAALGLLVSGIAHEINNPNNFISFNIPILRDFLLEMMDIVDSHAELRPGLEICSMPYAEFREDIFRLLSNLEHGAERINNTVTNLKEFVSSEEKPELRPTDPREVIEKAIVICQGELNKKVKAFEAQVGEALPRILTDAGSLEHVLVNLLINACQSMDKEHARLEIRAFSGTGPDHLVIEVTDNGCGMDENTMERIFEPFFTTKQRGAGTGLGLYVSRNLIERLGGEITVKSEIGQGTTFRVTLPVAGATTSQIQEISHE